MAEHFDVIIVGAGLSGIGAACSLTRQVPETSYVVLEARASSGGTWDFFRYPGVRSDSDMHTMGKFKPWMGDKQLPAAADILGYVREAAREHGVDGRIRMGTKWSRLAGRASETCGPSRCSLTAARRS